MMDDAIRMHAVLVICTHMNDRDFSDPVTTGRIVGVRWRARDDAKLHQRDGKQANKEPAKHGHGVEVNLASLRQFERPHSQQMRGHLPYDAARAPRKRYAAAKTPKIACEA